MAKTKEKSKFYYSKQYSNCFGPMIGTPVGRATFVSLKEPQKKYSPAKYGVTILFDKKDAAVKTELNKMIKLCQEMSEWATDHDIDPDTFTVPAIRDGDDSEWSKYKEYKGKWFITGKNKDQPEMVDSSAEQNAIDPALIASGVLVRAVVSPIIYEEGFSWKVHVVQFVKDDGVRFYSGPDPKGLLSALGSDIEDTVDSDEAPVEASSKKGKAKAMELL